MAIKLVQAEWAPVPEVVATAEKLLAEAKAGKIRAVAIATVSHDDLSEGAEIDHGWTGVAPHLGWVLDRAIRRLAYYFEKESFKD